MGVGEGVFSGSAPDECHPPEVCVCVCVANRRMRRRAQQQKQGEQWHKWTAEAARGIEWELQVVVGGPLEVLFSQLSWNATEGAMLPDP